MSSFKEFYKKIIEILGKDVPRGTIAVIAHAYMQGYYDAISDFNGSLDDLKNELDKSNRILNELEQKYN